jgi:hypothetical protein
MKGHSERELFTPREVALFERARAYVHALDESRPTLRCHELARAVGLLLDLPHQDGFYGFVDHSWLWTEPLPSKLIGRINFPNVLDVYSVGSLPMVRLVDGKHTSLPHVGWAYRPGEERKDIDMHLVHNLVMKMRAGQ